MSITRPVFALALACTVVGCGKNTAPSPVTTSSSAPASSAAASASALASATVAFPDLSESALAPQKGKLGASSVVASVCKLDTSAPALEDPQWWNHALQSMAVAGDGTIYVLDQQNKLRHYVNRSAESCELVLDRAFGAGGVRDLGFPTTIGSILRSVSVDARGGVHVSDGGIGSKDKIVGATLSDGCDGYFFASPDSSLALAGGHLLQGGSGCSGTYLSYTGYDDHAPEYARPHAIGLVGDEIVVAGTDMRGKEEVAKVGLHASDGKMRIKLGKDKGDERLASPGSATKCGSDLCVLGGVFDGVIYRWSMDGTFQGKLSLSAISMFHPNRIGAHGNRLYVSGAASSKSNKQAGLIVLVQPEA